MEHTRFSIIVPLYNKELYVEKTLQSIYSQTYNNFEVIVVDDGSKDYSFQIARDFLKTKPNAQVVQQENSGVAVARNNGVSLSRGQYICFLDSDDWWEDTFLEEMDDLIQKYPEAGLYGTNYYLVKNGQKRIAPVALPADFKMGYINYCQVYAKRLCMPITSSSVAIPKDIFYSAGQFRSGITLGEDFDLWIRIALRYKVALVNKPLSNYFQDIPIGQRATRRLHEPNSHMMWNLGYLENQERINPDFKVLMDRLRTSGMYRYYLSKEYHNMALQMLEKVDWKNVSKNTYNIYHSPIWKERIRFYVKGKLSIVKQFLLKIGRRVK